MGLQSYFQQHQPLIIEDYISVGMLIGGAVLSYISHEKRFDVQQKEQSITTTPPPYLYFPSTSSLDSLVQNNKDPSSP